MSQNKEILWQNDKEREKYMADNLFQERYHEDNRLTINGVSWSKMYDFCISNGLDTKGDLFNTISKYLKEQYK